MIGKLIKTCLLMLCLSGVVQASEIGSSQEYAERTLKESQLVKCYIAAENIEISNNEILYVVGDSVMPLMQLFCDEHGLYTLANGQTKTQGMWNCPRCGTLLSFWTRVCTNPRCNWPGSPS